MDGRMRDIFSSLFWLVFSIYASIESYRFGLGSAFSPGPGYFPFFAALVAGIVSGYLLFKAMRTAPSAEQSVSISKTGLYNVTMSLSAMVVYAFFLQSIGFVVGTFLLMVIFLRLVARQRWLTTLIVAVSIVIGAHILFNVLLDAQLTQGFLDF